ncbi:glycosyltransferase family 4 protein [Flammeovirga kamogawensis]|uniref:Glycosyltransferase family 4 protein n=1 Tax=Flammeovirga kamogawensis TaxID=373891 RepID=A0ABX8GSB5_9BACT|nr:glycosyltransferase family 4 protein [Flammeovirga kamogawensis]MBB6462948.1 hypothetical protein [Flammeovirga kamogawensis]QWG06475.1 hypothetical protein KM029_14195 [Flammeovirga kamogawensis]TRX68304.1 glycosyltransferase family 4 protein [Flammeovirga kamogawensis]
MTKKIVFNVNQFSYRGTEIALFDYAYYNEKILGNISYIISDKTKLKNSPQENQILNKFTSSFPERVFLYETHDEAQDFIDKTQSDIIYFIKSGKKDHNLFKNIRNVIHVVFGYYKPYGDEYFYISEYLAQKKGKFRSSFVPHIVNLPDVDSNLRTSLKIPKDATVVARYGGLNTFDIDYVHQAIKEVLEEQDNIYFIFVNTQFFHKHPRIIYLDPIYKLEDKVAFINTSDAYLHARSDGETFGLAIAEFHIKGKNIITSKSKKDNAHLDILQDECYIYSDKDSCKNLLLQTKTLKPKNFNVYKQFSPQIVMQYFDKVVIKGEKKLPATKNLFQKILKKIF